MPNFEILSDELTSMFESCLQDDRFCIPAGCCWSRAFNLPMCGLSSAQAADLHSVWAFHLHRQRFYDLGKLLCPPFAILPPPPQEGGTFNWPKKHREY